MMIGKHWAQGQIQKSWKPKVVLGFLLFFLTSPVLSVGKSIAASPAPKYTTFEVALAFTLYWEGGYSNNPADVGGRTYRGILQSEYNNYRASYGLPAQDVRLISNSELIEVYQTYWDASGAGKMYPALAVVMFDTAVNFGKSGSIRFLQEALGLPASGEFDAPTIEALRANNNKTTALKIINGRLQYRYKRVLQDPSQVVFYQGWLNRDYSLWAYISQMKV